MLSNEARANPMTDEVPVIGGCQSQLEQIQRSIFYSRAMGSYAQAYGVRHSKGILLHGVPGTGKTLIAREIGNLFDQKNVTVINGPELKNAYIGRSEENLREMFKSAKRDWKLNGEKSPLHVFIFDEIEVLFPARVSGTEKTGIRHDNSMTSQFLTILDGIDALQNVLIIGTTNRKNEIDPAVLRPGRLETHIEIPLPNLQERFEILVVKTSAMLKNNLLDESVDLEYWAKETKYYTGAELEFLVRNATQFAMSRNIDLAHTENEINVKEDINSVRDLAKVTQDDFYKSFLEIKPAAAPTSENTPDHDDEQKNEIHFDGTIDFSRDSFGAVKMPASTLRLPAALANSKAPCVNKIPACNLKEQKAEAAPVIAEIPIVENPKEEKAEAAPVIIESAPIIRRGRNWMNWLACGKNTQPRPDSPSPSRR